MRDQLKIVSNEQEKTLAYFCKNENEEWMAVPNTSKLSRLEYRKTTLQGKGKDILKEINSSYNVAGRGVDIVFIGSKNSYDYLQEIIKTDFPHENIVCQYGQKNVAVVGRGASKNTLLNDMLVFFQHHSENITQFIKKSLLAAHKSSINQKRIQCEDIIFTYAQQSQDSFLDGIPIIGLFTTDDKFEKMFHEIGAIYHDVFGEQCADEMSKILKEKNTGFPSAIKNMSNNVWNNETYNEKIYALFHKHDRNAQEYNDSPKLIALYGFVFLDAVEDIRRQIEEGKLQKIDVSVSKLREILIMHIKSITTTTSEDHNL